MSASDSSPSADRNLLFGILALQMDFVSRDALIKAMNAWVLQKSTPLGQILLDQAALRPDTHALLEALVQKHLEMHGGDAQKSLASVSSLGSARQQLEQIADVELHRSLAHVAAHRAGEDDPFVTRPPTVGESTSAGQRFRILRPHARGGLGEVFVAHDAELSREVALKEIQDRYADDTNSRSRFVLEAEITGGLEHPGIVPVYGLGQYADGRPFYAMRFIRGDSLQDAIRRFHQADAPGRDPGERSLSLRQLLGRFVDVCDAIDYAHSRGVLHRDLKPGNILLGKYGETLVVDWGLAKPLGQMGGMTEAQEGPLQPSSASGSARTQMGSAVGTPVYMSPEQAAGRMDQLGPASDVYSLGATLYSLLTGTAPFAGQDHGEILQRVQQGEFAPPRSLKPAVSPALEAVCLKAMAHKPEDRYASARALARDIEHWLADEPVSAWREPWPIRARRWVGRHRTLVTTAAATLLVATVSLTAATILLQAANARERQANADKEAALRQAEDNAAQARHQEELALEQKRQAEANAQEAKHQKELAEEQKRETEKQAAIAVAVNDFLQNDLLGQADIGRQMMGAQGERDPDVKVRTLLDRASKSIEGKFKDQPRTEAAIRLTIGATYEALGQDDESERHLKHSVRLRTTQLGADHPDTLTSKHNLAVLYYHQNKYDLAEWLYREVLRTRMVKLGADHPDTLISKNYLADLYLDQGKHALAESLYKEVLQTRTAKLGSDHPDTLTSKNDLGDLYLDQGRHLLAEPLLKEALQKFTVKLGAEHPHTLMSKNNLAVLYHRQHKYDLAEPLFKELLQTSTAKLGTDHRKTLISKNNLAQLYLDQGKYELAEPLFREVLQARTAKLGADNPKTVKSMKTLGDLYQAQGKHGLAESLYKEVLQIQTAKLGAEHRDTLTCKSNLASLYFKQGKYSLAEPLCKEVLQAETAKLGAEHAETLTSKYNLAMLYTAQSKYDLAEPLFRQVLQTRTATLTADHPYTLLAMTSLGINYCRAGRTNEAIPLLEEALQRARKLPGGLAGQLAGIPAALVMTYDRAELFDKSEPFYRTFLDETRKQYGNEHTKTGDRMVLLSGNLLRQKKYVEAEPILRDCLAVRVKKQPDLWTTFYTRSMLGEVLVHQKKYADAEPLLLQGYEGMKEREKNIPQQSKVRLSEALERLVQLYDAWSKKDKADDYRKKLKEERAKLSPAKK